MLSGARMQRLMVKLKGTGMDQKLHVSDKKKLRWHKMYILLNPTNRSLGIVWAS